MAQIEFYCRLQMRIPLTPSAPAVQGAGCLQLSAYSGTWICSVSLCICHSMCNTSEVRINSNLQWLETIIYAGIYCYQSIIVIFGSFSHLNL